MDAGQDSTKPKPKPCRVCGGFGDMMQKTMGTKPQRKQTTQSSATSQSSAASAKETTATAAAGGAATVASTQYEYSSVEVDTKTGMPCPEDYFSLGAKTWSFLHTMAAYYPEKPTSTDQKDMKEMMRLMSRFYPCHDCADHLGRYIKVNEPDTSSQKAFSLWMCRTHNEVNRRLGKPEFDCSKVDQRWKTGCEDA
eukprot:m.316346 g.316346  ORF g.316346 m.316346 type:complete len:195 (-) comp15983_c0_seq1:330-914(-)